MVTLSEGGNSFKFVLFPSEKGSAQNGKNLLPFLQTPFQKGLGAQESTQEVTKVASLVKMAKSLPSVFSSLNCFAIRGNFCRLLISFASSLDPDQAPQNVRPDLDSNCLTL